MRTNNESDNAVTGEERSQESSQLEEGSASESRRLAEAVTEEAFAEWYREREIARNIREGTHYYNGPSKIKPPRRHSPSDFLQCNRKIFYKQLNAPEETANPEGIFWFGSHFEEDLVLPFLEGIARENGQYVTNSLWVDFEVETSAGNLRIRGETDPVIVDDEARPRLLFEIKTKRSLENLTEPNRHHKAQAYAYMKGLTEKYGRIISEAVILYGSRTTLDVKPFYIEFDVDFWKEVVLDWAGSHTTYRLEGDLPPAEPEYDWECEFCSYKQRCGKGRAGYSDEGPTGLLPLFSGYPRQKLVQYLESYPDAKLTPTLAHQYPDLSVDYGAYDWHCETCGQSLNWDIINRNESVNEPTPCPKCSDRGPCGRLVGPRPSNQPIASNTTGEGENSD